MVLPETILLVCQVRPNAKLPSKQRTLLHFVLDKKPVIPSCIGYQADVSNPGNVFPFFLETFIMGFILKEYFTMGTLFSA